MIEYNLTIKNEKNLSAVGTEVTFKLVENKRTNEQQATEVKPLSAKTSKTEPKQNEPNDASNDDWILRGTVILKKDSYGFIESEDHSKETFFHYSELSGKPEEILVCQRMLKFS